MQIKKLGLLSLLAVAVGLVVSQGVMVMMLHGAGMAGLSFVWPLALAWVLALTYACSFSELALMIPKAGSLSSYTEVALGQFTAIVATFSGYIVVAMFALSAELLLLDLVVSSLFPGLAIPPLMIGAAVLLVFTLLNLLNIDVFARLQFVLAAVMVVTLLALGFFAISSPHAQPIEALWSKENLAPMGWGVIVLVASGIWGFVGAEFVCPLVEQTERPERNIPRAMMIGLSIIFVTVLVYGLGALLVVPREELANNSLPHYLYALNVFGTTGKALLLAAAFTATCSTLNSSLATISRMLSGMAENGQAFTCFKIHSARTGAPWVAVVFVALITGLPMLLMSAESVSILLLAAALCWLLAYIVAHINVMVLRHRYPDLPRPFRTPFYPLPQLFGIGGMLYAMWEASPSPDMTGEIFGIAGGVLALVAIIAALWVKFVMRKPLFRPEPIEHVLNQQVASPIRNYSQSQTIVYQSGESHENAS
ncbi:amino acid APC family transporter [Salmonella enterica subsp. enterica serovar Choleraesuis]|nr:amino acid APC family transporter [Salmonella enterica subsp. enterica serovar Choleraesuis]